MCGCRCTVRRPARSFSVARPWCLKKLQGSRFAPEMIRHLTGLGMQSACWMPLVHRGQAIGTLMVASRLEGAFTLRESEMLAEVAHQGGHGREQRGGLSPHCRIARPPQPGEAVYLEEEINLENRFEDIVGESSGLRQVLQADRDRGADRCDGPDPGARRAPAKSCWRAPFIASAPAAAAPSSSSTARLSPPACLRANCSAMRRARSPAPSLARWAALSWPTRARSFWTKWVKCPSICNPRLLRALQEREIERLGGTRPIQVNVRLIAATNRDLAKMVAEKEFRSDLFYRLKVFPSSRRPCGKRVSDIPVLVRHFVTAHSRRMGKAIETIPDETMEALTRWKWPGNIRELENFLERAVILTRGSVLYVPLAELEIEEDEQGGFFRQSHTAGRGARTHSSRAP